MSEDSRPSFDDLLLTEAWLWSMRGTCSRRQVGAVIATSRGVTISHGYNGSVSGMPHCDPHEDYQPCDRSSHSERNAIYFAARKGIATEGCYLYSTDSPCMGCAKAIIQSGIVRLVYERPYREDQGLILLIAAGVKVEQRYSKYSVIKRPEVKTDVL